MVKEVNSLRVEYSSEADAAYVYLAEGEYCFTASLDDDRHLDYSTDGRILGLDLMFVGRGVLLHGLPRAADVAAALHSVGIKTDPANGSPEPAQHGTATP
jgi:uncharacterized protein YuzE